MDNFPDPYKPPDTAFYGEDPTVPLVRDVRPVFFSVTDAKLYAYRATDEPPSGVPDSITGLDTPVEFNLDFEAFSNIATPNATVDTYWLPISYVAIAAASTTPIVAAQLYGIYDDPPNNTDRKRMDGVKLEPGMRVLIHTAVDPKNNGIYIVKTGQWVYVDESPNYIREGMAVYVLDGAMYKDVLFACTYVNPKPWFPGTVNLWSPISKIAGHDWFYNGKLLPSRKQMVVEGDGVQMYTTRDANVISVSGSNDAVVAVAVDYPVDFASPFEVTKDGHLVLDNHTLYPGDTVLLNAQTNSAENGVYRVTHSADPAILSLLTVESAWNVNAAHVDGMDSALLDISGSAQRADLPLGDGPTAPIRLDVIDDFPYTWIPLYQGNSVTYDVIPPAVPPATSSTLRVHLRGFIPTPSATYNLLIAPDWRIEHHSDGSLYSVKQPLSTTTGLLPDTRPLGKLRVIHTHHRFDFVNGNVIYASSGDGIAWTPTTPGVHPAGTHGTLEHSLPLKIGSADWTTATSPTALRIISTLVYTKVTDDVRPLELSKTLNVATSGYLTTEVTSPVVAFGGGQHMSVSDPRFASLTTKPFTSLVRYTAPRPNTASTPVHVLSTDTYSYRILPSSSSHAVVLGSAALSAHVDPSGTHWLIPLAGVNDVTSDTSVLSFWLESDQSVVEVPRDRPASRPTLTIGADVVTSTTPQPTKAFSGSFHSAILWDRILTVPERAMVVQAIRGFDSLVPTPTARHPAARVLVRSGTYANRFLFFRSPLDSFILEPRQLVGATQPTEGYLGDIWFMPRYVIAGYPLDLRVTPTSPTSVSLTWTPHPQAAQYEIYSGATLIDVVPVRDGPHYEHTGLTPGSTYCYTVVSRRVDTTIIETSEEQCAITPAPLSPKATTLSDTDILITWNANPQATRYDLNQVAPDNSLYVGPGTSYTHSPLAPDSSYAYQVISYKPDLEPLETSSVFFATTLSDSDPLPASILSAVPSDGAVHITYSAPAPNPTSPDTVTFVSRDDRFPLDPTDGIVTGPIPLVDPVSTAVIPGPGIHDFRRLSAVYVRAYTTAADGTINTKATSNVIVPFLEIPISIWPTGRYAYGKISGLEGTGRVRSGAVGPDTYTGIWTYGHAFAKYTANLRLTRATLTVARAAGGPTAPMMADVVTHTYATPPASVPTVSDPPIPLGPPVAVNDIDVLPLPPSILEAIDTDAIKGLGLSYATPDLTHTWVGRDDIPVDGMIQIWHSDQPPPSP